MANLLVSSLLLGVSSTVIPYLLFFSSLWTRPFLAASTFFSNKVVLTLIPFLEVVSLSPISLLPMTLSFSLRVEREPTLFLWVFFLLTIKLTSGQLINYNKSSFYTGRYSPIRWLHSILTTNGFSHKDFSFTHLGCPIYSSRKLIHFSNLWLTRLKLELHVGNPSSLI